MAQAVARIGKNPTCHTIQANITSFFFFFKYICVDSVAKLVEHFYEKAYRNMLIVPQVVARLVKAAN